MGIIYLPAVVFNADRQIQNCIIDNTTDNPIDNIKPNAIVPVGIIF